MKESSHVRASHVSDGTAIDPAKLCRSTRAGRQLSHPKLTATLEDSQTTSFGGLALAASLVRKLGLARTIDQALVLFGRIRIYQESDHVLTHVYNLFLGGSAIEDIAELQQSEPIRRMLGAGRIPDPTTAGDFLRRFAPEHIGVLDGVVDEAQRQIWRERYGRKKQKLAVVDMDSHVHHVYGNQKQGADFTYKGGFGYHPLVISLAETHECLRVINRPGNVASADGAAKQIESLEPLLHSRFRRVLWRGDSAFASQEIFDACERHGMYFAIVSSEHRNFQELAEAVPQGKWRVFRSQPQAAGACEAGKPRRKRGKNLRRKRARERGKRDLRLEKQWIAEIDYRPARSGQSYRLIIRRQRIEESFQGELFEVWRYRYVLTNLPTSYSTEQALRQTYRRCDQENVIEQLQSGVAAMRAPTGTLLANAALMACARIAHNLKAWLAQTVLAGEVMRWHWKRFRHAYLYVAARVVKAARQTLVRISDAHRFAEQVAAGIVRLQT